MAKPIDAAVFSDLVGAIYDSAVDPGLWPETLARLAAELRFATTSLALTALPSGRFLINLTSGIAPEWLAKMHLYIGDIVEMWGGPARMEAYPLDRPSVLSRVNPRAATSGNRFIEEWGRPQGLVDSMVVILAQDAELIGNLGFGRHGDAGPIEEIDVERTRLFVPHLQRAARIGRLLEVNRLTAASFEQVLGALAMPVILVGADLRLVHGNAAARAFLDGGDALTVRDGRLFARSAVTQRQLLQTIERAGNDETGLTGGGLGLPLGYQHGAGLGALHVLPLSRGQVRSGIAEGAAAAIFVSTASTTPARAGEVLAALYDLTPAEARVLDLIAAGRNGTGAASDLGIAASTVKTHLLRIFDKTGARSQADLVRLTAALASPIGSGDGSRGAIA